MNPVKSRPFKALVQELKLTIARCSCIRSMSVDVMAIDCAACFSLSRRNITNHPLTDDVVRHCYAIVCIVIRIWLELTDHSLCSRPDARQQSGQSYPDSSSTKTHKASFQFALARLPAASISRSSQPSRGFSEGIDEKGTALIRERTCFFKGCDLVVINKQDGSGWLFDSRHRTLLGATGPSRT